MWKKKFFSYVTIIIFVINFLSIWIKNEVYALNNLNNIKNNFFKNINEFNKKLDKIYIKINKKVNSKIKLEKKSKEIDDLFNEYKLKISNESNIWNINKLKDEVKNRALLKSYNAISDNFDFKKEIKSRLDIKISEHKEALDTLINSIKIKKDYRIIIENSNSKKEIENILKKNNDKIKLKKLFNNNYEIIIPNDSFVINDIFTDLSKWSIPKKLLKFDIVEPKIFYTDLDYTSGEKEENLWWIRKMNADLFQEWLKSQNKIKVWIIDTWVFYEHLDLKENIYINKNEILWNGVDDDNNWYIDDIKWYDFWNSDNNPIDSNSHGTHIAWIVWAAVNWFWIYWVNSNVEIVPLKVFLDDSKFASSYAISEAVRYAADNWIKVVNMSLSWEWNPETDYVCNAIEYAKWKWVFSVVAAWNNNIDSKNIVPSSCKYAISVWSVNSNLTRSNFSNYGDDVDFSAPWESIYSTLLNNTYWKMSWTSMATPHISWLISAIFAYENNISYEWLISLLKRNSIKVNTSLNKPVWSFIDMEKVMNELWVNQDNKEEPIINEPIINEPIKEKPITKEPKKEKPITKEPKKEKPIIKDDEIKKIVSFNSILNVNKESPLNFMVVYKNWKIKTQKNLDDYLLQVEDNSIIQIIEKKSSNWKYYLKWLKKGNTYLIISIWWKTLRVKVKVL